MKNDQIARVCHEANRALQIIQNDPSISAGEPWLDLDLETRDSVIQGVAGVRQGNTPAQSHENWVRFKMTHGWTLGPVKDEKLKQHPLLVPFDQLPESQRIKDDLFVAIATALLQ